MSDTNNLWLGWLFFFCVKRRPKKWPCSDRDVCVLFAFEVKAAVVSVLKGVLYRWSIVGPLITLGSRAASQASDWMR